METPPDIGRVESKTRTSFSVVTFDVGVGSSPRVNDVAGTITLLCVRPGG